mmetsp:Transcript_17736/g.35772  ORF Transcript_17736/g.35772 Transcript_17736/m.35772 type:complete len:255 (-) Transcript_17736:160-924(-)
MADTLVLRRRLLGHLAILAPLLHCKLIMIPFRPLPRFLGQREQISSNIHMDVREECGVRQRHADETQDLRKGIPSLVEEGMSRDVSEKVRELHRGDRLGQVLVSKNLLHQIHLHPSPFYATSEVHDVQHIQLANFQLIAHLAVDPVHEVVPHVCQVRGVQLLRTHIVLLQQTHQLIDGLVLRLLAVRGDIAEKELREPPREVPVVARQLVHARLQVHGSEKPHELLARHAFVSVLIHLIEDHFAPFGAVLLPLF